MTESSHSSSDSTNRPDGDPGSRRVVAIAILVIFLLIGVGAIVAAVLLLGSSGSSVKSADEKSVAESSSTTASTQTSPGSSESTGAEGSVGSTASTTGSAGTQGLAGASTTPVSVPFPTQDTALLKAVRVAHQAGYDRVVFEFDGPAPGYVVKYVPGPVTEDPSDRPVSVKGDKFLQVTMNPASGVALSGSTYREVYTGPRSIDGPGSPVAQVVRSGDFEAVLSWVIGVNGEKPFKVSTLTSPSRLVIDVAG